MKNWISTGLSVLLAAHLAACRSSEPDDGGTAELGPCCTAALELVAQMPECCQRGTATAGAFTGCCAEGMAESTADADRPDCCRTSLALVDGFSPCCRETLVTGEPDACCAAMPAALEERVTL